MNELEKGLEIAAPREIQEEALPRFEAQIRAWDIALPSVPPLVLDFGLGDFYQTGLIEYWIANEMDAGYCAKYLFVFDGQTCPMHRHKIKHETFFLVKGALEVVVGRQNTAPPMCGAGVPDSGTAARRRGGCRGLDLWRYLFDSYSDMIIQRLRLFLCRSWCRGPCVAKMRAPLRTQAR